MVKLRFKSPGFEAIRMQRAYSNQLETTIFMSSLGVFLEISLSKPN